MVAITSAAKPLLPGGSGPSDLNDLIRLVALHEERQKALLYALLDIKGIRRDHIGKPRPPGVGENLLVSSFRSLSVSI